MATRPYRFVRDLQANPSPRKTSREHYCARLETTACACGPLSSLAACQPETRTNTEANRCGPSFEVAGHSCVPRNRSWSLLLKSISNAQDWQRMIDDGEVENVVQLSKKTGIPQTQIRIRLQLLRLSSKIIRYIKDHTDCESHVYISERRLCGIALLNNPDDQCIAFNRLVKGIPYKKSTMHRVVSRAASSIASNRSETSR